MTNTDDVWKRDEIESPCSKVCVLHTEAKICIGCHRTADEVRVWSRLTPEKRREIMDELPSRSHLLRAKRQGRAKRRRDVTNTPKSPDDFTAL